MRDSDLATNRGNSFGVIRYRTQRFEMARKLPRQPGILDPKGKPVVADLFGRIAQQPVKRIDSIMPEYGGQDRSRERDQKDHAFSRHRVSRKPSRGIFSRFLYLSASWPDSK